jgi:beta-phosphoglucomutase
LNKDKAIIFDFDGTLIDSVPVYFSIFRMLAKKFGQNCKEEDFTSINGVSISESIRKMIKEKKFKKRVLLYLFLNKRKIQQTIMSGIKLFPHTIECLKRVRGFPMVIATNANKKYLQYNLERFNLLDYFQVCVTKEDVRYGKPSPDVFMLASKKIGVPPEECVVIEDSPAGVTAAKKAGMRCIVVLNKTTKQHFVGEAKPDIFIDDLSELAPGLINGRLWEIAKFASPMWTIKH